MTWLNAEQLGTLLIVAMVLIGIVALGAMYMILMLTRPETWDDDADRLYEHDTMPELRGEDYDDARR